MMEVILDKTQVKKYAGYKDSRVEWLGEIPKHWEIKPIRAIFQERNEKNIGPKTDFILSVTRDRGVIPYDEKGNVGNNKSEDIQRYKIVYPNDLVLNKMNVIIGSLGLSKYFGALSQVYIILQPKAIEFDIRYYTYIVQNESFYKSLIRYCSGIMQLRESLNLDEFKKLPLPIPPSEEQAAIADFLDEKTVQIDKAIAQKEKLIGLLKERRQILIHRAVTRGLAPNVPMKDSGVEWIGEIPAHWEVKRLKHITTKIGSGVTPTGGGSTYLEVGIPFLRSQNVLFEGLYLDEVAFISEKTHAMMRNSQVKRGDVLLNITGGSLGRCFYVECKDEMNVNQHVCIVRPSTALTTVFLNTLLASELGQKQIWFFQQGGGREGLNFQALKNFFFPLPPMNEQERIAQYIKITTKQILSAIDLKEQEIEKLREYKSVLINAAVTGKIRVE